MTARKSFASALRALGRALAETGKPHMLIGGMAVIARGIRRVTQDLDATIWAEGVDLEELLRTLAGHGISPRIRNAVEFARQHQVLLLAHRGSGTPLDLSLSWLPFEREALARAQRLVLEGVRIPVASPHDLIVYKAVAWRERDRTDIARLLARHRARIDLSEVRRRVREFAHALDAPERIEEFERIVEEALPARRT